MKLVWIILAAMLILVGCGKDQTVTVGKPGEKGEYRHDIDKAKDTAATATDRIKSGEKEVYGG